MHVSTLHDATADYIAEIPLLHSHISFDCSDTFTLARLASLIQSLRRQIPGSSQAAVADLGKVVSGLLSRSPEAGADRSNGRMSTPDNKGYLGSGWTSKSPTTKPTGVKHAEDAGSSSGESALRPQRGGDHLVSHRHRLSLRNYPRDCPPLLVQWFHAVDVRFDLSEMLFQTDRRTVQADETASSYPNISHRLLARYPKMISLSWRRRSGRPSPREIHVPSKQSSRNSLRKQTPSNDRSYTFGRVMQVCHTTLILAILERLSIRRARKHEERRSL